MVDPNPAPDRIKRPCPFITFYSFKGGVGRSMAVINVAGILASRGFRVLVIDMDLEAPGLSFLANPAPTDERARPLQPGFVDLLLDAVERGNDADLFRLPPQDAIRRYSTPYELPEGYRRSPDGALHIMPAGRIDDDYASRLTRLDLPSLYQEGLGLALVKAFKQVVQGSQLFDYVFVDSRTGFSDESGICTRDLADCLMVVSGLNKQNVEGTTRFLAALRRTLDEQTPIEVILSPIPNGEDALVDARAEQAQSAFHAAWGAPLRTELHIPYHPQLALTEEPHIFRRTRGYLFDAYNEIEQSLLSLLGDTWEQDVERARAALKAKRYAPAEAHLRHADKLSDARQWAGIDLFRSGAEWVTDPEAKSLLRFIVESADATTRTRIGWLIGQQADAHVATKPDLAAALYERVLEVAPEDADLLGNYALFLKNHRGDLDAAEAMYERALAADPKHANTLGNYARLCLARNRLGEGMALVDRALALRSSSDSPYALDAELWMYVLCCGSLDRHARALEQLRTLVLTHTIRTGDWGFSGVIEQARAMAHPHLDWLPVLADVLGDRRDPIALDDWPAWRMAAAPAP